MFKKPKLKSKLDIEIDSLIAALDHHDPHTDAYGEVLERLLKLHKIRQEEKPDTINPNTALTVAANLVGILMIIRHEHINVITTKAMSFLPKIK